MEFVVDADSLRVKEQQEIFNIVQREMNKFLGFLGIHHTAIKKELQDKFLYRISRILKSFLSTGNKVKVINIFAVPLLTYSFWVVKWSKTDLEALKRTVHVASTKHRMRPPKSVRRESKPAMKIGGVGIIGNQALCVSQIQLLRSYFVESQDRHELYYSLFKADHGLSTLHLAQQDYQLNCNTATDKKSRNVLRIDVEYMCRKCNSGGESIQHVIVGYPVLAGSAYLDRLNDVAKIVHH
uniref:Uncharacterized protein n=1 Tax=Anopheles arabiensis TaxID=7173 RepID=A0A182HX55_ANOAR